MTRLAAVLLVDSRNWLLLQERDEHAPSHPDVWGFVGGHVEEGEDFEPAAYRELLEETGLTLPPGMLKLWRVEELADSEGVKEVMHVYVAKIDIADEDIILGEGRQIVLVDPSRLAELDMIDFVRRCTDTFVRSNAYRSLIQQEPVRLPSS